MDYSVLLGVRYIHEGEEPLLSPLPISLASMEVKASSPRVVSNVETKTPSLRPSVVPRYHFHAICLFVKKD
jgi:hypothetical protein